VLSFIKDKQIYFFLLLLLSIGIGLQIVIYKIAIAILFLQWLISKGFKQKFIKLKKNIFAIGLIVFYFLYCISFFWSDNNAVAFTDMILKLPLLILPIVILSQKNLSKKKLNQVFLSFALSSLFLNLYSFFRAYSLYLATNNIDKLYYSNLTLNMHTSAQSMFTCFSIALFVYLFSQDKNFISKWMAYSAVIIQLIFVFLLSSRMQILIMAFLVPVYLVPYYYKKKKVALGILYTLFIFGFSYLIITIPSTLNSRYDKTVSQINSLREDNGNYDARKFIWKEGLEVIKNNWLIGTGSGDATDALTARYFRLISGNPLTESKVSQTQKSNNGAFLSKRDSISIHNIHEKQLSVYSKNLLETRIHHYKIAYQREYNFHNQYLQTFGAIGVFGFLILCFLIIYPVYLSIKKKDYLAISFLFIVGASCLTESIFERQAGVAFYALFYVLLIGRISQNKLS
jgi:O-antigen ligase